MEKRGEEKTTEGRFSCYHIVVSCSLFFITSLLLQFLVHFFLILICFIVINLFSMFLLFYFLQFPLRHISSWTEQFFCATLSQRRFLRWALSNSPPILAGFDVFHISLWCLGFWIWSKHLLLHSESIRWYIRAWCLYFFH